MEPKHNANEVKHTPTPWHLQSNFAWSDESKDRGAVFECHLVTGTHVPEDQNKANAAYIVRAVNAHEELIGLLKRIAQSVGCSGLGGSLPEEIRQAIAKAEK